MKFYKKEDNIYGNATYFSYLHACVNLNDTSCSLLMKASNKNMMTAFIAKIAIFIILAIELILKICKYVVYIGYQPHSLYAGKMV